MADFEERITHLINEVGDGTLTMGTVVQQPYAAAQHQRRHEQYYYGPPAKGIERYLEIPFAGSIEQYMMRLTYSAVTPEGSSLLDAARENADHMANLVKRNAPIKTGWLRESADAYVYDAGATVYYREGTAPYNYDKE